MGDGATQRQLEAEECDQDRNCQSGHRQHSKRKFCLLAIKKSTARHQTIQVSWIDNNFLKVGLPPSKGGFFLSYRGSIARRLEISGKLIFTVTAKETGLRNRNPAG